MTDQPELGLQAPILQGRNGWERRRLVVYAVLLYCAVEVSWIIYKGGDSTLNREVATALIALAGATVGYYVFGPAWERVRGVKWGSQ